MGRCIDLTGQTFGRLVVKERAGSNKSGRALWLCECSCGEETTVTTKNLSTGETKSCGCIKKKDLTGKKFGRLTVIEDSGQRICNKIVWKCLCDCGNEHHVITGNLLTGKVNSCGCLRDEVVSKASRKHGGIKNAKYEYLSWNKLRSGSFTYLEGKRSVPEEWNDFVQFLSDVGNRPSPRHKLSRHDVRKPHSKENTYWRDPIEERRESDQLTTEDLSEEFSFDFRTYLRTTATA